MGNADHGWGQVCLAAIMAQVGACVPAASLELTPVDKIFVRMGARDNIVTGQVKRAACLSSDSGEQHAALAQKTHT